MRKQKTLSKEGVIQQVHAQIFKKNLITRLKRTKRDKEKIEGERNVLNYHGVSPLM
jgi:hypothetical protein